MRYAVIADIHSNPDALSAVLDDIGSRAVDRILCCGDLVGYNASPNEAIELMRQHSVMSIAGNHDLLVSGVETDASAFSRSTARAVMWTKTAITKDNLEYLRQLPRTTLVDERILLFHGALVGPPFPEMRRLLNIDSAKGAFGDIASAYPSVKVAFFGHIHSARVYIHDGEVTSQQAAHDSPQILTPDNRYLVCPGSVCESRDRDTRASYATYDTLSQSLEFRKVDFSDRKTRRAASRAGLKDGRLKRLAKRVIRRIRRLNLKPNG